MPNFLPRLARHAVVLFVAAGTPSCTPSQPPRAPPQAITRTLLAAHAVEATPGWETRLYLIEYAPGAVAPVHRHPYAGVGYVLSGRFESAFGDGAVVVVGPGKSFVDQPRVQHTIFRNPDPRQPLRFVIAYTIPLGEPTLVQ